LEAARLAPSGSNSQPWRFKVVKDRETRLRLSEAAFNQKHVAEAPVVLVCCADLQGYLQGTVAGIQDLLRLNALEKHVFEVIEYRVNKLKKMDMEQRGAEISFNVAIAVEHIVLRAVELGLGTCWVRLADGQKIKELFNWGENISFVALLLLGYPAETPEARRRLSVDEILLD
jgi:nitroreductase